MRKLWLLAFALIIINSAYAVGIAPAKISLSIPAGETQSITFFAVNDLGSEVFVEPYISGELATDAKLPGKIRLAPKELTPFSITITMPNSFKEKYSSYVGVMSAAGDLNSGLTARIAAESLLEVKTTLNKPALQATLGAKNKAPVSLHLNIKNPTTVSVNKIAGKVTISDVGLTKLASFKIVPLTLAPSESKEIIFDWVPTRDGEFSSLAEISFAGGATKAETNFKVGQQFLDIISANVSKNGNIVSILAEVENKWNSPAEVWAGVAVLGPDEAIETQLKTQTVKIPPGEKATLNAYWETDKNPDLFGFDITVHYGDKTAGKRIFAKQKSDAAGTNAITPALSKLTGAFSRLGNINIDKKYSAAAAVFIISIFVALFAYQKKKQPPERNASDEYYRKYYEYLSRQGRKT